MAALLVERKSLLALLLFQHSNAHHEDYQQFLSSGRPRLFSWERKPAHTASLRHATRIDSPSHFQRAAVHGDPGTKMAISLLLFQTWSAWKWVYLCQASTCMLSSASQMYIWPWQPIGRTENRKIILFLFFIFLPHWKTSEQPCYSSAYGIGTPNQSRNPVYCPSFALPCPLSEEKRHSKSIPFLYSAVPAETRRHALDDGDRKKKERKEKKDGNIKQRVDSSSRDLFSSPCPPFSSSCIHTKTGSTGGRRQSDSDVFLFALWLFTSSFSCSPSRPRSHYLAFYPSAFLSVHGSSLHTGAGCSVVMGEETLPVQGHLWMCLCWETKVAS